MGIREKMNENPKAVAIGVGALVLVVIVAGFFSLRGGSKSDDRKPNPKIFYTDDDGASYFTDSIEKLGTTFNGPHGKEAVRAYVYQDGNEKPFVGWMETHTPEGKAILQQFYSDPAKKAFAPPETPDLQKERMAKRPKAEEWVRAGEPGFLDVQIMQAKPGGDVPRQLAPDEGK